MKLTREELRRRLTSRRAWELRKETSAFAPEGTWTNIDIDPTPIERRTWTSWTVVFYWFSDILSIQGWESMATFLQIGLTYREALWCTALGDFMIGIPVILNGYVGSLLRVPFPVQARSSFGYHFAKVAVVIRIITAIFWFAIQSYSGSQVMVQVIAAIWPSFQNLPNHIPASQHIDSKTLVAHFLFWCMQLPFLLIPPQKMKWFLYMKFVFMIATTLGVAIGMSVRTSSPNEIFKQTATVQGSKKSWLSLYMLMETMSGWATMATNIADVSRYIRNPRSQLLQVLCLPLIGLYIGSMGLIASSASKVLYGEYVWSPAELLSHWTSPLGRAAAFFTGISFCIAQIGINMTANCVSIANDLTSLLPRYLNIRRSAVIGAIIAGWVMVPWKISGSAPQLVTFISSLAIFLAPISGICISDFYIVHKQKINVPELYNPHGCYRYNKGFNFRAAAALIIAVALNLPGLINSVNSSIDIGGAQYIADLSYLVGIFVGAGVYSGLNFMFPHDESQSELVHAFAEPIEGVVDNGGKGFDVAVTKT